MSETMTARNHLDALPDDHRERVRSKMERVRRDPEGLRSLWDDVDQPEAERPVHDIADFSRRAHDELASRRPGADIPPELVWQTSLDLAAGYAAHSVELAAGSDAGSPEAQEAKDAVESVVVMAALNKVNMDERNPESVNVLDVLRGQGLGGQIDDAIEHTAERGLVIQRSEGEFIPVSQLVIAGERFVGRESLQSLKVDESIVIIEKMRAILLGTGKDVPPEQIIPFREASRGIDWGDLPIDDADRLVSAMASFDHDRENILGAEHDNVAVGLTLGRLRSMASNEALARLYKPKNNGEPSSLNNFLNSNTLTSAKARYNAQVLAKIYYESGGLDQVNEGEDPAVDRLSGLIDEVGMNILSIPEKPSELTQEAIRVHDSDVTARMTNALGEMGLSEGAINDYLSASGARLLIKHRGEAEGSARYIDGSKVVDRLFSIKRNVDALGVDAIERLRDKLSVTNIDNYEPDDLEGLNNLLDESPSFIEHLQAGDVTVVFVDALGDHNGATEGTMDNYRKASGRTLLFEVKSPGDFYRRMALLKRLGIKPSTLVLSAHGSPGNTIFGGGLNRFNLVANERSVQKGSTAKSMFLDKARLDRIVSDEFMQPCKGIDSPDELTGRMQLIINSCSSDKEFAKGVPTTAVAIAKRVGRTDTDVYGARDVTYVDPLQGKNAKTFSRLVDRGDAPSEPESITSKITLEQINSLFGLRRRLEIKNTLVDNVPINRQEG